MEEKKGRMKGEWKKTQEFLIKRSAAQDSVSLPVKV